AVPPVRTCAVSLTASGAVSTVAISWLDDGCPAGAHRPAVTHTVTAATAAAPKASATRRAPSRGRARPAARLPRVTGGNCLVRAVSARSAPFSAAGGAPAAPPATRAPAPPRPGAPP